MCVQCTSCTQGILFPWSYVYGYDENNRLCVGELCVDEFSLQKLKTNSKQHSQKEISPMVTCPGTFTNFNKTCVASSSVRWAM